MAYAELPQVDIFGTVQNWYYTVGSLADPSSQLLKPDTTENLLFTHFNIGLHGASTWLFKNQQENIQPSVTLRVAGADEGTIQQWTFPFMNNTSGFNANLETEILLRPEYGFNVVIDSIYSGASDISFRFRARSIQVDPATTTPFS